MTTKHTVTVDPRPLELALNDLNEVMLRSGGTITQGQVGRLLDMLVAELSFVSVTTTTLAVVVPHSHYERVDALRKLGK